RIQPLMQRSAERCHDARFGVTDEGAVPAVITAPHWDAELSLASAWLSRVFSENPRARAALVVPKLASRRAEVEGAMRRIAGSPRVAVLGDAARVAPALSAALT